MRKLHIPVPRWLEIALAAAVLSVALTASAVRGEYDLGPGRFEVSLRPKLSGVTIVSVPPFGTVEAATHRAPTAVVLSPVSIDAFAAQELVERRPRRGELIADLRAELEEGLRRYALRLAVGGLVAGLIAAGIARARTPWELVAGLAAGVLVPVGLYAATFAGYNPEAFRQPALTGALSRSPELLGPVTQFGERFNALRTELDEIGSVTFQLYQFLADQSPIPQDAVKILHISDLHLNPVGYDVAQQVARRFDVAAVIDSGDVTAEGSPVEVGFVDRIRGFPMPYLFVRGNHDSPATQQAVAAQPNARILDGSTTEINGVTIFGIGDPLFTPDKTVEQPTNEQQRRAKQEFARMVEDRVAELPEAPDAVVVHDRISAGRLAGQVPLILHGHEHRWTARQSQGTRILGVASTGGAGLKSLSPDSESTIALQVLYFDRESAVLLGYDRIDVTGPTQDFRLKRTIVSAESEEESEPAEAPAPEMPAGAESPSAPTPAESPPPQV
ncbi:MAG TPA: metallophosphoesterase [Actinomycetota bacterium]|nr:metallophosphoesterase [Actinomycetota bacterium]